MCLSLLACRKQGEITDASGVQLLACSIVSITTTKYKLNMRRFKCKPLAIYPANYRSPRTRANSRELGRTPREFASSSPTLTLRRTPPNVRRSTPNVRRSSAEFARVRPSSLVLRRELANGSPENSFAGRNPNHL